VIMERCYVAAVSGISEGRPVVEALLDSEGTVLDGDRNPLPPDDARASVERVRRKYQDVPGDAATTRPAEAYG